MPYYLPFAQTSFSVAGFACVIWLMIKTKSLYFNRDHEPQSNEKQRQLNFSWRSEIPFWGSFHLELLCLQWQSRTAFKNGLFSCSLETVIPNEITKAWYFTCGKANQQSTGYRITLLEIVFRREA